MCGERVLIIGQVSNQRCLKLIHQELLDIQRERRVNRCEDTLRVNLHSSFVINCLDRWSKGWIRRAGEAGEWKNSRGKIHYNTITLSLERHLHQL